MSESTCREVLDGVAEAYPDEGLLPAFAQILAARVEKVLVYCATEAGGEERESLARMVVRLLDGEEP